MEVSTAVGIDSKYEDLINNPAFDNLLHSKTWVGENGTQKIRFDSPQEIVHNIVDIVKGTGHDTQDLQVIARESHSVSNKEPDSDETNTSFGRAQVEFRFPRFSFYGGGDHLTKTVGFVWAFDMRKPELIVYSGYTVQVCLNLQILRADTVHRVDYLTGSAAAYNTLERFISEEDEDRAEVEHKVELLANHHLPQMQVMELTGNMLFHVLHANTFGASVLNTAVKLLGDSNSRYHLDPDGGTSAWNYLGALTQHITDKGYVNVRPVKTHQVAGYLMRELGYSL